MKKKLLTGALALILLAGGLTAAGGLPSGAFRRETAADICSAMSI